MSTFYLPPPDNLRISEEGVEDTLSSSNFIQSSETTKYL